MKKAIGVIIGILVVTVLALAVIPTMRDEIHWQWASLKHETASYGSYVKTWPAGRHATEALARIESLHWQDATTANTLKAFHHYMTLHPQGSHVREAGRAVASLRTDDAPFDAALKTGTEASLKQFLEDFPGHRREPDAQQALKDITEGRDIVDALEERKIEVQATGSGIESLSVNIRKHVPYSLTVRIPVGTFFVSADPSVQNMVTTAESRVQLTSNEWESVSLDAACANRRRDIPEDDDTFTVRRSPNQAELAKLLPIMEKTGVSYDVRQAAVWIITDNADYDDLGILVSEAPFQPSWLGGIREIREYEAAQAMRILDEAGINIKQKAIWRDRQTIISGLEDDDLKTWLKNKK